jgi:hypothetical protein
MIPTQIAHHSEIISSLIPRGIRSGESATSDLIWVRCFGFAKERLEANGEDVHAPRARLHQIEERRDVDARNRAVGWSDNWKTIRSREVIRRPKPGGAAPRGKRRIGAGGCRFFNPFVARNVPGPSERSLPSSWLLERLWVLWRPYQCPPRFGLRGCRRAYRA